MTSLTIITKSGQFELPLPDEMTFSSKGISFKVPTDYVVREGWEAMFMGHWFEHFTNGVKSDTDAKCPMPAGSQAHMDYINGKIAGVCGEREIKARASNVPPVVAEMRRIIIRHMGKNMGYKAKDLPLASAWGRTVISVTDAALGIGLTIEQCQKAKKNAEVIVAKDNEGL